MGFPSQDDLISKITVDGQFETQFLNKTISVAQVAGTWTDLSVFAGFPVADTYAGTSLTYVATDEASTGAIPHSGDVTPATKHALSVAASVFAAAGAPWIFMCLDQVGYVPITGADVTGTGLRTVTMTALDGTARYPNGAGLRAYFSTEVAPTAGGPNLSTFTYTNQAGTPGKTCPNTVNFAATPVAGQMPHSGNAANRFAPFIPLAAGDTGIRDFESFTLSGGSAYTGTGQLVLHLVKPLFWLPVVANGILGERDLVNQLMSMPRIRDDAYLKFLMFQTGATTVNSPVVKSISYGWGGS
jgi:hypothetical protein